MPKNSNHTEEDGEYEFQYQKSMLSIVLRLADFSFEESEQIEKTVDFLEQKERENGNGKLPIRKTAKNFVSQRSEPRINHSLGVCIFVLGILDKALKTNLPPEKKDSYLMLKKKQFIIAVSSLLHDVIEDSPKQREEIQEEVHSFLRQNIHLSGEEMTIVLSVLDLLSKDREKTPQGNLKSIQEAKKEENPQKREAALLANFIKSNGDIPHNMLSPLHSDSQKKKYRLRDEGGDGYTEYFMEETDAEKLFPGWFFEQVEKENPSVSEDMQKIIQETKNKVEKIIRPPAKFD
ncbi:hypothetical protein K9M59_03345 [Candidatus Gracilibacteria bacterium]|nr:hypothetical protein [Candidatus Gracilibacteria bacterium]MCF7819363.1 hypothetical protein [Candidatus Gracilibacteria bacterium]